MSMPGALLKGVIDETGLLRGGEIYVQIAHARAGTGVERDTATYHLTTHYLVLYYLTTHYILPYYLTTYHLCFKPYC